MKAIPAITILLLLLALPVMGQVPMPPGFFSVVRSPKGNDMVAKVAAPKTASIAPQIIVPPPTVSVTLGWNASTDSTVVGYNIYYGCGTNGQEYGLGSIFTNTINAGNATNLTVTGLVAGRNYYFAATGYTASGMESPFSNAVGWTTPPYKLGVTRTSANIMLSVPVVGAWTLQSSKDLLGWNYYLSGTNTATVNVPIQPQIAALFFRLEEP